MQPNPQEADVVELLTGWSPVMVIARITEQTVGSRVALCFWFERHEMTRSAVGAPVGGWIYRSQEIPLNVLRKFSEPEPK